MTLAAIVCIAATLSAQPSDIQLQGRPLAEALQILQSRGLKIVFSTKIVALEMRVDAEPRSITPRAILTELLAPHGLRAVEGPASILQIVRAKRDRVPSFSPREKQSPNTDRSDSASAAAAHAELVEVFGEPLVDRREPGVALDVSADLRDLHALPGAAVGSAFRAVHTLAGVASTDDFTSEFSVRGSPYRHIAFVIDGVSAPWLTHAAYGRGHSATMTMLGGDSVEAATLRAGAYPRRESDRLGAQLAVTLREGSRESNRLRGTVSATYVSATAEGPLGTNGRGSWIASVRNSHRDWPVRYNGEYEGTALGYTDAHAKLVYDVKAGQQFSFTLLGGRAGIDERDNLGAQELSDGMNRAGLATLAWRSTIGRSVVLTQRASLMTHQFANRDQLDTPVASGSGRAATYRTDLVAALGTAILELGGQAQHVTRSYSGGAAGSLWEKSAYGHIVWSPASGITIAPGLRVATSTLGSTTVAPWLLTQWSFKRHWTMYVSTALSQQSPDLDHVIGIHAATRFEPERATSVDLGVLARVNDTLRFQATIYSRAERNLMNAVAPMLVPESPARDTISARNNTLVGSAYGIELSVDRRKPSGLSGWASYSYGHARQRDRETHEPFWADFDQRHAINAAAFHAVGRDALIALQFRAGTNFPIPGYLTERDGRLFVGGARNAVRLPTYARLDVSANRTFVLAGRQLTVFAEVLNILNRANVGLANGSVNQQNGEATGFTKRLFGPMPGIGLTIRF